LRKLEGNGARTQILRGVDGIADGVLKSSCVLAGGLSVRDADHQDWLARTWLAKLGQDNAIDDLLAQLGPERCETLIPPVRHDLGNLLLGANVSEHVRRGAVIVHEADLDAVSFVRIVQVLIKQNSQSNIPVLVEEGCCKRDPLHDKLQVLDALALFFERHRTTVINVDDDVVKSKSEFH
jgi:hypothetical protein